MAIAAVSVLIAVSLFFGAALLATFWLPYALAHPHFMRLMPYVGIGVSVSVAVAVAIRRRSAKT